MSKRLKSRDWTAGTIQVSLRPNSDGGISNAYLGFYGAKGAYLGSLEGRQLSAFAKALQPYIGATKGRI